MYEFSDHPIVLDQQLYSLFGPEYYEWLPDVLRIEMYRKGCRDDKLFTMAHGVQLGAGTIVPFEDWFAFEKETWALTGYAPNFKQLQPPTLPQVYISIDILSYWSDRDTWDRTKDGAGLEGLFNEEVWGYVSSVFAHEKIPFTPPPYSHLQPSVRKLLHIPPDAYTADYYGDQKLPQTLMLKSCEAAVERSRERLVEESARLQAPLPPTGAYNGEESQSPGVYPQREASTGL